LPHYVLCPLDETSGLMRFALNAFRCQSSLRLSITHRDIYFIDAVQGDLFVIIIIILYMINYEVKRKQIERDSGGPQAFQNQ
jgi:hypothetical protein